MTRCELTLKAHTRPDDVAEIAAHGVALATVIREKCGDDVIAKVEALIAGAVGTAILGLLRIEVAPNG